ncbi:MAG: class I SAM-dependent methyltransferase [Pseudomonadota bacterium]|nr:class I SAM-dependent methyltransferase [Pseudomonadota bacterium]
MVKYVLAALALKAFSLNDATKKAYRSIGNVVGQRARQNTGIGVYVERGDLFVALCKKYGAVPAQAQAFELGTEWMHWYSLYLRLYFDLHITMLDVWDNRQLAALQTESSKHPAGFKGDVGRLDTIVAAPSFGALYDALGLCYVIEPDGSPRQFADGAFDLIFSFHCLEHVPIGNVKDLLADFHRTLKPGGYMIHQIGIDDYLQHYDPTESPKTYLRFSDRPGSSCSKRRTIFQSAPGLRLDRPDWLRGFHAAGADRGDRRRGRFADRAGFQALSAGRAGLHHSDLGAPKAALGVPKTALNRSPRKGVPPLE